MELMLNWLTFRLFYFLYFRSLNLKLFQINGTLQKNCKKKKQTVYFAFKVKGKIEGRNNWLLIGGRKT